MLIDDDLPVAVPVGDTTWHARALATAAGGRVDIVGIETAEGLTVATHRKVGWRYWSNGQAMAQDLNLEDTARSAVSQIITMGPSTPDRHEADVYEAAITRLASEVHNQKIWPTRPIQVDGESFVLFTTTTTEGQAAVADLGPVRLAIYGPSIPSDGALRLSPLASIALEIPPRAEEDE